MYYDGAPGGQGATVPVTASGASDSWPGPWLGPWKFTQFSQPSTRLVLIEKNMYTASTVIGITQATAGSRNSIWTSGTGATILTGRHGSAAMPMQNCLFLDMHVESMTLKQLQQPAMDADTTGKWDPAGIWGSGPN
jgi:hypothetical protein